MSNFRYKLASFMYGRYGSDKFNYLLIVLYLLLWAANLFVRNNIASLILYAVGILVLIYMIFRMFSRNIPARSRENQRFLKLWSAVSGFFKLAKNRLRDIKGFRYRKCKSCKAQLRLPKQRGLHTVKCPRCGNRFKVRIVI